jgi:hypothetical protein
VGNEIAIQLDSLSEKQRKAHPEQLSGSIVVNPPKGTCFTVTKRLDQSDIVLCDKKTLKFEAEDLNADGSLTWQVSTGHGDIGTTLTWPSRLRRGKVVDLTMEWPGSSRLVYLYQCNAQESFDYGRRIFLRLLSGERWVIVLPKEDHLIDQPPPMPNLYIGDDPTKKKGVVLDYVADSITHINVRLVYPSQSEQQKEGKWVATWQTHPRGAMQMSADGFIPEGSQTPGMRGKCWYKYSGHPDDKESGLIECHDVQDFRWILLPLTCIHELKAD